MVDSIWGKWSKGYLQRYQTVYKSNQPFTSLPGKDGHTRMVTIKARTSVLSGKETARIFSKFLTTLWFLITKPHFVTASQFFAILFSSSLSVSVISIYVLGHLAYSPSKDDGTFARPCSALHSGWAKEYFLSLYNLELLTFLSNRDKELVVHVFTNDFSGNLNINFLTGRDYFLSLCACFWKKLLLFTMFWQTSPSLASESNRQSVKEPHKPL